MSDARDDERPGRPADEALPVPGELPPPGEGEDEPVLPAFEGEDTDLAVDEVESLGLGFRKALAKVREFPRSPGVYFMKDVAGRVIYIGKAKTLRSRAGSYFLKAAAEDMRTRDLVREIGDIEYLSTDSEVDAILLEARLIRDIQPKYNRDLRDDRSFPYLEIHDDEDFPRVEFTRQPSDRGTTVFGPFTSSGSLRGAIQVLQRIFRFRTCTLDIEEGDDRWRHYRPCILASIRQCTAPCNLRISKHDYRQDIRRLKRFLNGDKTKLIEEMRQEMKSCAAERAFERAARLRDEIKLLETLDQRGNLDVDVQPQVFHVDPQQGVEELRKILGLKDLPRRIEGVDIAHLQGDETVASLVQFLDGLPFKAGYRHYRIRGVTGIDDFRSIHEVVGRRFRRLSEEGESFPDVLLIDGGKGQLNAALAAFEQLEITPPTLVSLAKREEEIYRPGQGEPLRLSRHSTALRLLQFVRDEAHRFAQHFHHLLRSKAQFDALTDRPKRRPGQG